MNRDAHLVLTKLNCRDCGYELEFLAEDPPLTCQCPQCLSFHIDFERKEENDQRGFNSL